MVGIPSGRQKRWRSKSAIELEKYQRAVRKFWRDHPLAYFDRQYRYLINCGVHPDPLTFPFQTDMRGEICPDLKICRSYVVCAKCDAKRANIYSWDGYLCLKCANVVRASNRLLSHCEEIEIVIKQLKGKIREARQGTQDQRRPAQVPLRDDGGRGQRHDRREEGDVGGQAGGADQ